MIKSKLTTAEDSIRAALIYALENKKDQYVSKLFNLYNTVRDVKKSVTESDYVFNLTGLDNIGGSGTAYDSISYPSSATPETIDWLNSYGKTNINISSNSSPDIISFS